MSVNSLKEILTLARENRYGVPSLLGGDLEMVIGQVMAAEEKSAPLILAFNQDVTPAIPMELGISLLVNASKKASIPICTILDHGKSLEDIIKAILSGISSVMFDGSELPYEENVRRTREVVKVAHAVDVCVEGELGVIGGSAVSPESGATKSTFTDPYMAADFVEKTGVDVLAISFGNVHGVYNRKPFLDFDLVKKIHTLVDVPLAMHGGSGLNEDMYEKIIESGITKIGYYTAMARGVSGYMRTLIVDAGEGTLVYHDIISQTINYFYEETKKILDVLKASGTVMRKQKPLH